MNGSFHKDLFLPATEFHDKVILAKASAFRMAILTRFTLDRLPSLTLSD